MVSLYYYLGRNAPERMISKVRYILEREPPYYVFHLTTQLSLRVRGIKVSTGSQILTTNGARFMSCGLLWDLLSPLTTGYGIQINQANDTIEYPPATSVF